MNTNYSHCIEGGNVEMRKPVEFGRPCAVYRHYDAAGALLYVGCSTDPAARLYSHFKESAWAKLIASVTFEWFDDRADALAAEILRAVSEDRTDFARFACRSRTGLPVYRISLAERGVFYAVVAPAKDRVVTLIEPGGLLQRGGKRKAKRLRA